ncbi:MAG: NAD(+)/NADH kinase [Deltaproteobacteria bacterium]|nr:NAD(+)/NADH kinase [Deltaproteobacteria bacterium]
MSIGSVSFIVNPARAEALSLLSELTSMLVGRGIKPLCEEHVGRALGLAWAQPAELASADLCVVMGGDGTLLHAAYTLGGRPVPVLGVNLGSLGFLTEVPRPDVHSMLERVLAGDYQVEPRMKLRVHLHRNHDTEKVHDAEVLNDAVIAKGALARIADLSCSIDGLKVTTYKADGVIVSTPTGSTGYSLSANGPIVYPTMNAVIVTPICPHTLTQRPIVVPDDREISLRLLSETAEMYLTLDGQTGLPMLPGDRVQIKQSKNRLMLIKNPGLDFFSILRTKLRWGER